MPKVLIEEVFKLSGIPTYNFVKPAEYQKLIISLRTPGRGLVIEGPSGIGKTTCISKALEELGSPETLKLSARKKDDRDLIAELPTMKDTGTVVVDDFHRLPEEQKKLLADHLKTLADEENPTSKLIIIGINEVGDSLVKFATDLNNRIDTIRLESNSREKISELVTKGELALNVRINTKTVIAEEAHGSFHLAQMLCHDTCLLGSITESQPQTVDLEVSFELVRDRIIQELHRAFFDIARKFATGPRLRRQGRAPYLHLLYWLGSGEEWTLNIRQVLSQYPEQRGSVGQIIDKGYLVDFLRQSPEFNDVLHYEENTSTLSAEDPKFIFFLRNLVWSKFARKVGFLSTDFESKYDFALSFAGPDRAVAELLFDKLTEAELSVFYDKNEQHRIIAENVEDYLAPIYRSEAEFVITLLSKEYPKRIWTKFESQQFKDRFGSGSVIPIWFSDAPPGLFDETIRIGGVVLDVTKEIEPQLAGIAEILLKKLETVRTTFDGGVEGEIDNAD